MPKPFDDTAFAPPTTDTRKFNQTNEETHEGVPVLFGALTMVYGALVGSFWGFTLAVSWMIAGLDDGSVRVSFDLVLRLMRTVVVFGGVPVGLWSMYRPRDGLWVLALFALAHLGTTAASAGAWTLYDGDQGWVLVSVVPFVPWPLVLLAVFAVFARKRGGSDSVTEETTPPETPGIS